MNVEKFLGTRNKRFLFSTFSNLWVINWKYSAKLSLFELIFDKFGYVFIIFMNFGLTINCRYLWDWSKSGKLVLFPIWQYRWKQRFINKILDIKDLLFK